MSVCGTTPLLVDAFQARPGARCSQELRRGAREVGLEIAVLLIGNVAETLGGTVPLGL